MPLYQYEPTVFSEDEAKRSKACCFFETLQAWQESPLVTCPTCGSAVHRVISTFSMGTSSQPPRTQGSTGAGASGANEGPGLFSRTSGEGNTPGGRAARMAMRHICGMGCRH